VRADLSHADVPDQVRAAVLWRLYERAEIGLIHRHLPEDVDVVELGASLGVTACHALSVLGRDRRLVAVEANPSLIGPLEQCLDDTRATVVHAAIDYSGSPTAKLGVHSSTLLSSVGGCGTVVDVPAMTLSDLLDTHGIGRFALLCDIEGAEAGILFDDPGSLERCELAIIEQHGTERATIADLASGFSSLGFRAIDEARDTVVYVR
jgi:FkbM family methyltransferase